MVVSGNGLSGDEYPDGNQTPALSIADTAHF